MMNPLKIAYVSLAVATLLLAAGCNDVEERLSWSPDGSRAVLRSGDTLFLVDANGTQSTPLASNVFATAWLPNGQGLILHRQLTVADWREAAQLLPSDQVSAVQSLAKGVPDLLKAALAASDGDLDKANEKFIQPLKIQFTQMISPAILYLRAIDPGALQEAINHSKDPVKLEADLSNLSTTTVSEVSVLMLDGNKSAGPPRVIERTCLRLQTVRPSPAGTVVAFLHEDALIAAPLDGSTNRLNVADNVVRHFDWTTDGKTLVYAVQLAEPDRSKINIVRIEQRTVVDATGALASNDPRAVAMTFSTFEPRLCCLPGGRVVFAGTPMQLPANAETSTAARIYIANLATGANAGPTPVPAEPGALPEDLAAFAPSPDGKLIAIVESGSDSVAVLDVATGALEVVSPNRGWKCRTLPAWRGTNELYFAAVPDAAAKRPEFFRWHKGSAPQIFSRGWPAEAVNELMKPPGK